MSKRENMSLAELSQEKGRAQELIGIIQYAIEIARNSGYKNILAEVVVLDKKERGKSEYGYGEASVERDIKNDRSFPLETIMIERFRSSHDAERADAIVHTGSASDELARSLNVLAFTIGRDIYFRNNAYQPESEEGRVLLAHELTHVQQYEEKRIEGGREKEKLEEEASRAEEDEYYIRDKKMSIRVRGKEYEFRESQMNEIREETARKVMEWIGEKRKEVGEEEYLRLMSRLMEVIEKGEGLWET